MAFWGIFELAMSAVGVYNIIKGSYCMYRDAENIKDQYRQHQRLSDEYKRAQLLLGNPLTDSQYHRLEGEFLLLNKSCILDPHNTR